MIHTKRTAWVIEYIADCEGDWFTSAVELQFYPSYEAAAEAARSAYRGPDDWGNEAHAEAVHVLLGDVDPEDTPRQLYRYGSRFIKSRPIAL